MADLPLKLAWKPCPCGHRSCKRSIITNLGTFDMGSGFEPDERRALDEAWVMRDLVRRYLLGRPPAFAVFMAKLHEQRGT